MKLVYKATQQEVKVNDMVTIDSGVVMIISIEKPRHGGSTGRVYVQHVGRRWQQGYYPVVIGAEWIEREDQTPVVNNSADASPNLAEKHS